MKATPCPAEVTADRLQRAWLAREAPAPPAPGPAARAYGPRPPPAPGPQARACAALLWALERLAEEAG